tara:strand:+ start:775 stop:1545 length:771 start_codon:yes stop_codon:yes gene_type:complete
MTIVWSASASLSLNAVVAPTDTRRNNGLFFKVTQAGTTGSSEPNWSKEIGETVYDNNVRYVSFSSTFSDVQSLNPSAIIELFILTLKEGIHYPENNPQSATEKYYFHSGTSLNANGKIEWQGQEYFRFPVEATGFAFQRGQLPRPKLIVSNATGLISLILMTVNETTSGNDLTGATITRIRTLAKFLDAANFADGQNSTADPTAEFPREIYGIDRKSGENRDVVEFELAAPTDLMGIKIPKRTATREEFPGIGTFS